MIGERELAPQQAGHGTLIAFTPTTTSTEDDHQRLRQIAAVFHAQEQPIECRPADLIKPQLESLREEAEKMGILKKEEDLITYALYPNVAPKFLRGEIKEEAIPAA